MSSAISAKVPRKLKEKARRYGLKISEIVRKALEEEVKKVEEKKLSKDLEELSSSLKGRITKDDVVKAIRSSRDER
jgi:post-segregation antitoxin (ccd killing protein)